MKWHHGIVFFSLSVTHNAKPTFVMITIACHRNVSKQNTRINRLISRKYEIAHTLVKCLNLLKCVVTICVVCLFLAVPWVGFQSVIVAFPGHTHLIF